MAVTIESSIIVNRPLNEVYQDLLDLRCAEEFDPDVKSVEKITEGPIEVGTKFRFFERTPPLGKFDYTFVTYTDIRENEWIGFEVALGRMRPMGGFEFEARKDGTKLTFKGEVVLPGLLRLLAPLFVSKARSLWKRRLDFIKNWEEEHN